MLPEHSEHELPRLSSAQLETLTVIAYYQPATRAYIEQIRGVDSAYSVGALSISTSSRSAAG